MSEKEEFDNLKDFTEIAFVNVPDYKFVRYTRTKDGVRKSIFATVVSVEDDVVKVKAYKGPMAWKVTNSDDVRWYAKI